MGSISGISVKLQFSQKITAGRNQFQSPLDLCTYIKPNLKKKLAPSLQSPLPTFSRERIIHTIAKCLQLLMLWSSFIIGLLAFCQLVDVFCTPILPICGPVLSLRNFYFGRQREVKIGFIQRHPSNYIMVQQYQQSILTFKITQGIRTRHILSQK